MSEENKSTLVVLVHGLGGQPTDLNRLGTEIMHILGPRCETLVPKLAHANAASTANPVAVCQELLGKIDEQVKGRDYDKIILVGHSLGAGLIRKVWVMAHGMTVEGAVPELKNGLPWAGKITRLVLMAAMSRGWSVSSALNPVDRLKWWFGTTVGDLLRSAFGIETLASAMQRGAPFLTTLRLECLALSTTPMGQETLTVQLLGSNDDYVAPSDNIDIASGHGFYYLEVPGAKHREIVMLGEKGSGSDTVNKLKLALTGTKGELAAVSETIETIYEVSNESPDDFDVENVPARSQQIDNVVFVIHGIRDRGFWTRRLAMAIKRTANGRCRTVTSTYGYFPMGPFLLPWKRLDKVRWLLDQYVTAKALYPNAKFSYVGHSNGTYLLAKALELCPAIKFDRVVFAGSVVRTDYDWQKFFNKTNQVQAMINYVATRDRVVAIFPYGLERMGIGDLGGAGHLGFKDNTSNVKYVRGEHSAALAEHHWPTIADFVLGLNTTTPQGETDNPEPETVRLGWLSPLLWGLIVMLVAVLLAFPLALMGDKVGWAILFLVLWKIVTTVLAKA